MKNKTIERIIYVTSGAAIVIFILVVCLMQLEISSVNALRTISAIITGLVFFWAFYFHIGWKWNYLRRLVYKPNLNGTWVGCFQSDWKDENGNGVPIADMVLVIRQTFLSIHVTTFTKKFTSYSYGESFLFNDITQKRRLIYLYSKNPMQPNKEDDRQGACELQVFGQPENELVGEYWTHKKTNGFIKVKHKTSDHLETFENAKVKWTDDGNWNLIVD